MAKRTCSIEGCERSHYGRGFCRFHWYRWRRNGDPLLVRRVRSPELRDKLDRWIVKQPDGCWLWTGVMGPTGYGRVYKNGRHIGAHRVSYELNVGPIPDGLFVLHHCDVRNCVRPDHLFLGSIADNTADMLAKGRGNPPRGIDNAKSKLTDEKVREIRRLAVEGLSQYAIAARFGVHQATISNVMRGRTWKHVA